MQLAMRQAFATLVFACLAVASSTCFAQTTRTWVSGVGDDANPCSRTAPCRTFAGTISKTAAGGVISVLDPGSFGALTISKSITVEAGGVVAGVIGAGTNGIVINAAPTDVVMLRSLSLHGVGTGIHAIRVVAAGTLVVENCVIESFTQSGIAFEPAGAATLVVRDTVIRNVGTIAGHAGVLVNPGAIGSAALHVDRLQVADSNHGVIIQGPAIGTIRDVAITTTNLVGAVGGHGIFADGADASAIDVTIDHADVTDMAVAAVYAQGANAILRLSRSTITGNAQGLLTAAGGQIVSFGDNRISGNLVNGTPTQTVTLQ
jgi:hypothetical protein